VLKNWKEKMSEDTKIEEEYPMGYSITWYLHKHKEHEDSRTSTNDRNKYWREKDGMDKRQN
jgi:hypothetical protein